MCGNKSSSSASQTTYDNDVVAAEGAIAVGNDTSLDMRDIETGDVDAGGVGIAGDGNHITQSTSSNDGISATNGAQVNVTDMSEDTYKLLQGSLDLVGHNSDSLMKVTAGGTASALEYQPERSAPESTPWWRTVDGSKFSHVLIFPFALVVLVIVSIWKKGKR